MGRRDCLGPRDALAGDGMLGNMLDGIAAVVGDGVASARENARHAPWAFHGLAALAVAPGTPTGTFALERAEKKSAPGDMPTDEWVRTAQMRVAGDGPGLAPSREASAQLRGLREAGSLPRVCEFGMDKTVIPRHGGRPGEAFEARMPPDGADVVVDAAAGESYRVHRGPPRLPEGAPDGPQGPLARARK